MSYYATECKINATELKRLHLKRVLTVTCVFLLVQPIRVNVCISELANEQALRSVAASNQAQFHFIGYTSLLCKASLKVSAVFTGVSIYKQEQ